MLSGFGREKQIIQIVIVFVQTAFIYVEHPMPTIPEYIQIYLIPDVFMCVGTFTHCENRRYTIFAGSTTRTAVTLHHHLHRADRFLRVLRLELCLRLCACVCVDLVHSRFSHPTRIYISLVVMWIRAHTHTLTQPHTLMAIICGPHRSQCDTFNQCVYMHNMPWCPLYVHPPLSPHQTYHINIKELCQHIASAQINVVMRTTFIQTYSYYTLCACAFFVSADATQRNAVSAYVHLSWHDIHNTACECFVWLEKYARTLSNVWDIIIRNCNVRMLWGCILYVSNTECVL